MPFVFSQTIIMHGMHVDAHTWDNILKETVLWVTIMWSEMEKQNIEAKRSIGYPFNALQSDLNTRDLL